MSIAAEYTCMKHIHHIPGGAYKSAQDRMKCCQVCLMRERTLCCRKIVRAGQPAIQISADGRTGGALSLLCVASHQQVGHALFLEVMACCFEISAVLVSTVPLHVRHEQTEPFKDIHKRVFG